MHMSETGITLDHAKQADAPTIAKLHALSWQATYRGILPKQYLDTDVVAERDAYWTARMSKPAAFHRLILIAYCGDAPIGFVCAEQSDASGRDVLLDNLHALKAYQGYGAGKLMIRAVQDWARDLGAAGLYLYVLEGNHRAIDFYERQGWQFAGTKADQLGGNTVTARRYVYALTPI
jgi:GNAT superfamily N-acetyltransferase